MTPQPADYGRGPFGALRRFWLQPNDPTVLGFIRVMAGCIVVYVHLAFCFDLHAFFGPNAWWDQKAANLERTQSPIYAAPLTWPDRAASDSRARQSRPPGRAHRPSCVGFRTLRPQRMEKLRFYFKTIPAGTASRISDGRWTSSGGLMPSISSRLAMARPTSELPPEVRRDQREPPSARRLPSEGPNQIADVPKFIEKTCRLTRSERTSPIRSSISSTSFRPGTNHHC